MNANACNNLGYDREELLKMAVWDIDDIAIPNTSSWKAHVDNVKKEGHVVLEDRHRRKDGTTFPVEINVRYISLEKGDYMVAVARDITERKKAGEALQKSEERYKDLFNSSHDGIYQIDADGVFILMNPAGAKMLGYESPDKIIGRKGPEYWRDPKDRDIFKAELKIKKSVNSYHMRLKKKNGEPIDIETSSTIKEDEKGAFLGMEEILRDVTERKKLEDQLRHAQKMEAVGTLAGGIAHDFNNILNVILGYGVMLQDRIGSDQLAREQLSEVLSAAQRAADLTRRLLLFSRKEVAEMKPLDVNEMVINMEKMLSRIIGEDIGLITDLTGTKAIVMADAGQMEQVLLNLATNARDAMPKGGSLTIKTELKEIDDEFIDAYSYGKPGTYAVISIADTGTGIDKEKQDRIFDPFFTTKEVGKGTGLGLSIAYGIIKQHNGYIKVYSEPGKGTTFKILLPVIENTAEKKTEADTLTSMRGGTETILIAEDDVSLRKLTKTVLEALGYCVITAEDGADAITKFMENKDKIALVILDMIMPKKSGKEAYEEISKTRSEIKTLFVSGYTMDTIKTEEIAESGFDFLNKPVAPNDLIRKVREILDR